MPDEVSIVDGLAENETDGSGILLASVSIVDGAAATRPAITGSGILLAQVAIVDGAASVTPVVTGSGILEAGAAIVVSSSENEVVGSGTLEAQVSTADGVGSITPAITGSGILLAPVSTAQGAAEAFTPYVYMEGGEVYDYMSPDEIYVIGELQPE